MTVEASAADVLRCDRSRCRAAAAATARVVGVQTWRTLAAVPERSSLAWAGPCQVAVPSAAVLAVHRSRLRLLPCWSSELTARTQAQVGLERAIRTSSLPPSPERVDSVTVVEGEICFLYDMDQRSPSRAGHGVVDHGDVPGVPKRAKYTV